MDIKIRTFCEIFICKAYTYNLKRASIIINIWILCPQPNVLRKRPCRILHGESPMFQVVCS